MLIRAAWIADRYAAWRRAGDRGQLARALQIVDELEDWNLPSDLIEPRLIEMRRWRPNALLRLGRADQARLRLKGNESRFGRDWTSRLSAARLFYFENRLEEAEIALREAIVLVPHGAGRAARVQRLSHALCDVLCLAGRTQEARAMLLDQIGPPQTWDNADMIALRQTIACPDDLNWLAAALSGLMGSVSYQGLMALHHYSWCCREMEAYDAAEDAARRRLLLGLELRPFGAKPKKTVDSRSWVEAAKQALFDMQAAFHSIGAEFFLISGTLLGCVREGGILPHDKDIDVGVLDAGPEERRHIEAALVSWGCFSRKPYRNGALLRLQHANGVLIDVFWHRNEGGLILHEGLKSKWWNTPFALEDRSFLGGSFKAPVDVDRYLEENYGDWRVPRSDFETFSDTPNMAVTNDGEMIWYGYTKALDYYHAGRSYHFDRIARILLGYRPRDRLILRLLREVENLAAQDVPGHLPA